MYSESDTVITSAMKMLANSVYDAVGAFQGGKTSVFNVHNNGVGAAMEHNKFTTFSQADYDELYKKLQNGEWTLMNDVSDSNPATALTLTNTKVTYID